ncbi:lipoprotein LpqH [Mycobacterium sp. B14F4]|uniref:lipoprotein LpqH n=1 Tax=Mycobacterium sp. B14F4 TaxID=3153565 RepID=UPI00325DD013
MRNPWVAAAATALMLAGCSSDPPDYSPPAGELVAGTAEVTVNGNDVGVIRAVDCTTTGPLSTITIGEDNSGVTAMVSNQDALTAEFVRINDLGGFTGSYANGLADRAAEVTMTGRTYDITGTADGFKTDSPSFRVPGTFAVRVSC